MSTAIQAAPSPTSTPAGEAPAWEPAGLALLHGLDAEHDPAGDLVAVRIAFTRRGLRALVARARERLHARALEARRELEALPAYQAAAEAAAVCDTARRALGEARDALARAEAGQRAALAGGDREELTAANKRVVECEAECRTCWQLYDQAGDREAAARKALQAAAVTPAGRALAAIVTGARQAVDAVAARVLEAVGDDLLDAAALALAADDLAKTSAPAELRRLVTPGYRRVVDVDADDLAAPSDGAQSRWSETGGVLPY